MARGRRRARGDARNTEPCRLAHTSRMALLSGTNRHRILLRLAGTATQTPHPGFSSLIPIPATRMGRNCRARWTTWGLLILGSARRPGSRYLVGFRRAQGVQIHCHGLRIRVAESERGHPRFRLHRLRVLDPAIDPRAVQSEAGSIERRPDLAAFSTDAMAAVAAVLVDIEPLADFC